MSPPRSRWLYFMWCLAIVGLGLLSRSDIVDLPPFLKTYAGDTLWALLVYLGFCFLFPRMQIFKVALISLLFSYGIEFSQLYQAPWINEIRFTKLGGLILGYGFKFSDLICYIVGIIFGIVIDRLMILYMPVYRE